MLLPSTEWEAKMTNKNNKWDYNPSGNLMDETTRRLMCSALLSDSIIKCYDVDARCSYDIIKDLIEVEKEIMKYAGMLAAMPNGLEAMSQIDGIIQKKLEKK